MLEEDNESFSSLINDEFLNNSILIVNVTELVYFFFDVSFGLGAQLLPSSVVVFPRCQVLLCIWNFGEVKHLVLLFIFAYLCLAFL